VTQAATEQTTYIKVTENATVILHELMKQENVTSEEEMLTRIIKEFDEDPEPFLEVMRIEDVDTKELAEFSKQDLMATALIYAKHTLMTEQLCSPFIDCK
jgi:hypothetical protein